MFPSDQPDTVLYHPHSGSSNRGKSRSLCRVPPEGRSTRDRQRNASALNTGPAPSVHQKYS